MAPLRTKTPKPLHWVGSSKKDLLALPDEVRDEFGHQLHLVQMGESVPSAKALKGDGIFRAGNIVELIEDFDTNTYRCVFTARFGEEVYVLHVFQKTSRTGSETPKREIDKIRVRYAAAEEDYKARHKLRGAG